MNLKRRCNCDSCVIVLCRWRRYTVLMLGSLATSAASSTICVSPMRWLWGCSPCTRIYASPGSPCSPAGPSKLETRLGEWWEKQPQSCLLSSFSCSIFSSKVEIKLKWCTGMSSTPGLTMAITTGRWRASSSAATVVLWSVATQLLADRKLMTSVCLDTFCDLSNVRNTASEPAST